MITDEGRSMVRPANGNDFINIGLKKDQILQRFLARRIWKEQELRIVEIDGTEHVGFVTGVDDRCIQISTTPAHVADEPHSVLIFWPVRRIEETGRYLKELDHEHISRIRSFGEVLWKRCDQVMRAHRPQRNNGTHDNNGGSQHDRRVDSTSLFSEL